MSSTATTRALRIVGEYLGSAEKQVLKNAATALAAIGTPACAVHLAELAIRDRDADVRQRAIAELTGLDEDARWAAAERAVVFLAEPPKDEDVVVDAKLPSRLETRGHANDLLAALARQGTEVPLPVPPVPEHPALSQRARQLLTPVWTFLWTLALFWRVRHYLLREHQPPPLWWSAVLGFLGALPGGALTAYLYRSWNLEIGEASFLSLCLPPALLTAFMIAVLSRTNVPLEKYCDHRMGGLVETLGFLWSPGATPLHTLAVPLVITAICVSALSSLALGFSSDRLSLLSSLLWLILAWASLAVILAVMRAAAITAPRLGRLGAAAVAGLAGLSVGLLIHRAALYIWPTDDNAGVAIINSETAILLLPFVTAFMSERLLGTAVVRSGPSKTLVASLGALGLVVLPGLWLIFNPLQPSHALPLKSLEEQWWLARAPVWRYFRVDFKQRVTVQIEPHGERFELLLNRGGIVVDPKVDLPGRYEWELGPGDYELEVQLRDKPQTKKTFGFLVRESYASAVSLMARYLLESSGEEAPPSLVAPYELQLVLNAKPYLTTQP